MAHCKNYHADGIVKIFILFYFVLFCFVLFCFVLQLSRVVTVSKAAEYYITRIVIILSCLAHSHHSMVTMGVDVGATYSGGTYS